ncbi:hypothetical protein [Streptomyces lydicus]|uniref:hypothetical protein n=1 Tax=Streptomyces lydicus TaxID=47763 RepID=UPI0010109F0A|nr:hypothetical protein [Streptomyces lydicus]MCZ1012054.1 hypothetical protein [Streptomyces lydicus]
MPTTSSQFEDARIIAKGIRLGGSSEIVAAVEAAGASGPLTPGRIEQLAHPAWDRAEFEERSRPTSPPGAEQVGMALLYRVDQAAIPGDAPSWVLATQWCGWLPGTYASREAALLAYGYVLGTEGSDRLEELRDCTRPHPIRPADLIAYFERS